MGRKYLSFDTEIAKILPDQVDELKAHRPLGITCAGLLAEDEQHAHRWYSTNSDGSPAAQMSRDDLGELVDRMLQRVDDGYTIATWNGLGFDFDILAEESGRLADCQRLASGHVDMLFHVFCHKGFAVSLNAAAQAIGAPPKSLEANMAPKLWAAGDTQPVLDYLDNDCRLTLDVARTSERNRRFLWITQRGKQSQLDLHGGGWQVVRDAMQMPEPDTSWMTDRPPWPRSRFTSWLRQ